MALLDYRGLRLIAVSVIPIDKGTIVYAHTRVLISLSQAAFAPPLLSRPQLWRLGCEQDGPRDSRRGRAAAGHDGAVRAYPQSEGAPVRVRQRTQEPPLCDRSRRPQGTRATFVAALSGRYLARADLTSRMAGTT